MERTHAKMNGLMSILLFILFNLCAALPGTWQAYAAENMLYNPGFEEGQSWPDKWYFSPAGYLKESPPHCILEWTTEAHSGKKAVKLTLTEPENGVRGWFSGNIPIKGGSRIKFSGWIKSKDIVTGPKEWQKDYKAVIRMDFFDSLSGHYIEGAAVGTDGTSDWKYYEKVVTAPENAGCFVLRAGIGAGATGTGWFDDVEAVILEEGSKETFQPPAELRLNAEQRQEVLLNGEWDFKPGTEDAMPDSGWKKIRVPGAMGGDHWGAFDRQETKGWYRLDFFVPGDWNDGRKVYLNFDAVNYYARLFINGVYAAQHRGSYMPFCTEITRMVRYGKNNALLLYVQDTSKDDAYPTQRRHPWWGITGDVSLKTLPKIYISDVFVIPSVRKKTLTVRTRITNETGKVQEITIVHSVRGKRGESALEFPPSKISINPGQTAVADVEKPWENPILWGFGDYGSPYLYFLRSNLRSGNELTDILYTRFGFREFRIEDGGFVLNGKKIFLQGECMGSIPEIRQPVFMNHLLWRNLNINTVRIPLNPGLVDVADEFGMLLKAFIPNDVSGKGEGTDRQIIARDRTAEILQTMVKKYRNNPSVIIWVPWNELYRKLGSVDPDLVEFQAEMSYRIKEVDPTRPIEQTNNYALASAPAMGIDYEREIDSRHPTGRDFPVTKGKIPVSIDEIYPYGYEFAGKSWERALGDSEHYLQNSQKAYQDYKSLGQWFYEKIVNDVYKRGGAYAGPISIHLLSLLGPNTPYPPENVSQLSLGAWGKEGPAGRSIPYPSLSGKGAKENLTGRDSQLINFFDPARPAWIPSILYEQFKQAYRETNAGRDLPPAPETRTPEIIVQVTKDGKPEEGFYVSLKPLDSQAMNPVSVRTDKDGKAWFSLWEDGDYELGSICTTSVRKNVKITPAPLEVKPGWDYIQNFSLDLNSK